MDLGLNLHAQALSLRAQRAEVLANNLANADTPGYKAQDLLFEDMLKDAQTKAAPSLNKQPATHSLAGTAHGFGPELAVRSQARPAKNGNTVDARQETMTFAENALRYQASLNFLNGKIKTLLTAIKGE